jgi:hypothetical protein
MKRAAQVVAEARHQRCSGLCFLFGFDAQDLSHGDVAEGVEVAQLARFGEAMLWRFGPSQSRSVPSLSHWVPHWRKAERSQPKTEQSL